MNRCLGREKTLWLYFSGYAGAMFKEPFSSVAESNDDNDASIRIFYNKPAITKLLFLRIILMALCILGAVTAHDLATKLACVVGFLLFFTLAAAGINQLRQAAPALVLSRTGLRLACFASGTISWLDVISILRTKAGRSDLLTFKFSRDACRIPIRPPIYRFPGSFFGFKRSQTTVNLRILKYDRNALVRQAEQYLAAARAARNEALTARGEPVPEDSSSSSKMKGGWPYFTVSLIALLAAVYVAELVFAPTPNKSDAPSVLTLLLSGATNHIFVFTVGDWWRLFTAPLLHGNVIHILSNCIVLLFTGLMLERFMGWRWTSGVFVVSALAGSLGSVLINPPHEVSVGASGGIMGLLAALLVLSFRLPSPGRINLQIAALRAFVPSLLPIFAHSSNLPIDYANHECGAAAGAIVGFIILSVWPRERAEPKFALWASLLTAGYFLIAAASLYPIIKERNRYVFDKTHHILNADAPRKVISGSPNQNHISRRLDYSTKLETSPSSQSRNDAFARIRPETSLMMDTSSGSLPRAALMLAANSGGPTKTLMGTVEWTLTPASRSDEKSGKPILRAIIKIPSASLIVRFDLEKESDLDAYAPSFIGTIRFEGTPNSSLPKIRGIEVPQLRSQASSKGDPVRGSVEMVTNNVFLVGFPRWAFESSAAAWLQLGEWLDIPILFDDGRIAKLTFEESASGSLALRDAMTAWGLNVPRTP